MGIQHATTPTNHQIKNSGISSVVICCGKLPFFAHVVKKSKRLVLPKAKNLSRLMPPLDFYHAMTHTHSQ
jgi:hypothetical protein